MVHISLQTNKKTAFALLTFYAPEKPCGNDLGVWIHNATKAKQAQIMIKHNPWENVDGLTEIQMSKLREIGRVSISSTIAWSSYLPGVAGRRSIGSWERDRCLKNKIEPWGKVLKYHRGSTWPGVHVRYFCPRGCPWPAGECQGREAVGGL